MSTEVRRPVFLPLVVLLAACEMAPPDDAELVVGALKGGYLSFGDRAVGFIEPTGCTGTLVDPQIVLTGAGCANRVNGAWSGTFFIDVDASTRLSYPLEGAWYSGGEDPVALIRLAQPVPADVATPLGLHSSAIISMHETITIYGYGCHASSADPVNWRKQRRDPRYSDEIYFCSRGDAGGPLIKTFPSGFRAVAKVMNGVDLGGIWFWERQGTRAAYGLVYRRAVEIARQIDFWLRRPPGTTPVVPPHGGGGGGGRTPPIREN